MREDIRSKVGRATSYLEAGQRDVDEDDDDIVEKDNHILQFQQQNSATAATWEKLKLAVTLQRRQLPASEMDSFDSEWGLDGSGEFARLRWSWIAWSRHSNAATEIQNEMKFVEEESKKKIEKLTIATDDHVGLEILHLFVLDVLGRDTAVARIFSSKTEEDFRHTQVVTRRSKALAAFSLVVLNLFFVYYTLVSYIFSFCKFRLYF